MRLDVKFGFDPEKATEQLLNEFAQTTGMGARSAYEPTVKIGVLEGRTNKDGIPVATYARANEFGVPGKIPARSFIRSTVNEKLEEWEAVLGNALNSGMGIWKALELVGRVAASNIQEKILSNVPPPNSPETRRRKGKFREDGSVSYPGTLVDTGALVDSIDSQVIRGGQRAIEARLD